jgi:predicted RNA binding protein YcfA (HicA-like mRNA interferase family)
MPPKIRDLIAELERAGFIDRGGKGSHRDFCSPEGTEAHHDIWQTWG